LKSIDFLFLIFLANNIEGEQESELLAEYEAYNKQQQQKLLNSGSRSLTNTLSPNKRRNVIEYITKFLYKLFTFRKK